MNLRLSDDSFTLKQKSIASITTMPRECCDESYLKVLFIFLAKFDLKLTLT